MQMRHATRIPLRCLAFGKPIRFRGIPHQRWRWQQSQRLIHYHITTQLRSLAPFKIPAPPSAQPTENVGSGTLRDRPEYEMTFTCKPCSARSTHRISKQGYHHGTVLVTCPECKNRHLVADHLKIFADKAVNVEDLMREQGQLVKRGHLGSDGSIEFWDEETSTRHKENASGGNKVQ